MSMADWGITVDMPIEDAERMLGGLADGSEVNDRGLTVYRFPTGWAWALSAEPDPGGSDIVMNDQSEAVQWTVCNHLLAQSLAPFSMSQWGGLVVVERTREATLGEHAVPYLRTWNAREIAARSAQRVVTQGPVGAGDLHGLVVDAGISDPADARLKCEELATELVRHEIMRPVHAGPAGFVEWTPSAAEDSSRAVSRALPDWRTGPDPTNDLFHLAAGRKLNAVTDPSEVSTELVIAWMREKRQELAADGTWVYVDQ